MKELIVGRDGFIGHNLCRHLPNAMKTTRRSHIPQPNLHFYDLTFPTDLPKADIAYICAGINGVLTCAQQPHLSYKTNVDGTIELIQNLVSNGSFVVWISSTTVMWLRELYGTQKQIVESQFRFNENVGIIRAGRVTSTNIDDLCLEMISTGHEKLDGIHLWNEDERPYEH